MYNNLLLAMFGCLLVVAAIAGLRIGKRNSERNQILFAVDNVNMAKPKRVRKKCPNDAMRFAEIGMENWGIVIIPFHREGG
jgi:hypothetical protein